MKEADGSFVVVARMLWAPQCSKPGTLFATRKVVIDTVIIPLSITTPRHCPVVAFTLAFVFPSEVNSWFAVAMNQQTNLHVMCLTALSGAQLPSQVSAL